MKKLVKIIMVSLINHIDQFINNYLTNYYCFVVVALKFYFN